MVGDGARGRSEERRDEGDETKPVKQKQREEYEVKDRGKKKKKICTVV